MNINLFGFQPIKMVVPNLSTVQQLVQFVLELHNIQPGYFYLFAIEFVQQGLVLECDQIITHKMINFEESIQIIPRHFEQPDKKYPMQLNYCIFSYCMKHYLTNSWNYPEINILEIVQQLTIILSQAEQVNNLLQQDIMQELMQNDKKYYHYTDQQILIRKMSTNLPDLFPERQKCMIHRVKEHLQQIDILYMDEFKALSLDDQLIYSIQTMLKSSYHHFYFYPVFDQTIDWTSAIGIARDGICLVDAEVSQAYLYLPFNCIKAKMTRNYVILTVNKELCKSIDEYSDSLSVHVEPQPTQATSMHKFTSKLPVYPKIGNGIEMEPLMSCIIENCEKSLQSFTTQDLPTSANESDFRSKIQLKFKNINQMKNFMRTFMSYSDQPKICTDRYMRIQSKTTTQLLHSLYLNNCVNNCSKPSQQLLRQLDLINDVFTFKNKKLNLTTVEFVKEPLNFMGFKSVSQSLIQVLNYQAHAPISICIQSIKLNYKKGTGTPYDPFVPVNTEIVQNVLIENLKFVENDLIDLMYITDFQHLMSNKVLKKTLKSFYFSENLLKNKGVIIAAKQLSGFHALKHITLNETKMKATGLACFVYLMDYGRVYLTQLLVAGVHIQTKNQAKQLALYILNSLKYNKEFELLDISDCFDGMSLATSFCEVFEGETTKIDTIIIKGTRIEIADFIRLKNIAKKIIV
ncbi:Conserved_hypothetical protein [Hexamita inflata]|uniref:FERM domain-containing protein n=1 Tax=Hexamita inflata TaxID=28002 RepID=A0AA86TE65_9EUKA|nr:Conserved hypothetical protein [Hexamita inflata]